MLDISTTWSGGTANNWYFNTGSPYNPHPITSFDLPRLWASTLGIVFNTSTNYCAASQEITGLTTTPAGYELKFTITSRDPNNPGSLPVAGILEFHITNDTNGFYYDEITTEGHYTVNGNFDASTYDITRTDLDGTNLTTIPGGVIGFGVGSYTSQTDIINFHATDFQGCIDNIYLKDLTNHFTGGSAGSFTFSGFDPSLNNYIDFDAVAENIVFVYAPLLDPPVQIQQGISKKIHNGDYYRVRFHHAITAGAINGYYFNRYGKGFRFGSIDNIDHYDVLHKVGDAEIDLLTTTELLNTLVIYVEQDLTNGSVDNL